MTKILFAIAGLAIAAVSVQAQVIQVGYDSITTATSVNIPSNGVAAGGIVGSGNRYIGGAINVATPAAGTPLNVAGFDCVFINATGAPLTATNLTLHYWVWDSANVAAAATANVFSTLVGSGVVNLGNITAFPNNSFVWITGDGTQNGGGSPGINLGNTNQIPISSNGPIGVTFAWSANIGSGDQFINGMVPAVRGGGANGIENIGSNAFPPTAEGYLRSFNGQTNGNFLGGDARNIGANSASEMRVWVVPTPAAGSLLGLGGLLAARRRRTR